MSMSRLRDPSGNRPARVVSIHSGPRSSKSGFQWLLLEGSRCVLPVAPAVADGLSPAGTCSFPSVTHPTTQLGGANCLSQIEGAPGATGNYIGCFVDNAGNVRDLTGGMTSLNATECAAHCSEYTHFGLQYRNDCFCGNTFGSQGAAEDAVAACGEVVDGMASLCGNGQANCINYNAVYAVGARPTPYLLLPPPVGLSAVRSPLTRARWSGQCLACRPPTATSVMNRQQHAETRGQMAQEIS